VNICSMQSRPSQDPRDQVVRAALADAAVLAAMLSDEYHATYTGSDRAGYLAVLATWLADLGCVIEDGPGGASATFDGRRIAIRFGPLSGHR
jgi:hypothetical protein